jgi:hypothetical protein
MGATGACFNGSLRHLDLCATLTLLLWNIDIRLILVQIRQIFTIPVRHNMRRFLSGIQTVLGEENSLATGRFCLISGK